MIDTKMNMLCHQTRRAVGLSGPVKPMIHCTAALCGLFKGQI
jgi:hypothetical protein